MAQHYSVFFSYRHKPLDAQLTQKAFNILEAYRLPAALKRRGHDGVERCFRDTEELPVSRVLTSTIQEALFNSDYLVVVCSPDTPSSEWVDREVATFIELGRAGHIYPLLISGSPEVSFPPSLKKIPDIMERVMDVREQTKSLSVRAPGALFKVLAAVAKCKEIQLVRAEKLRSVRRTADAASALIVTLMILTGIAAVYWLQADSYRAQAQQAQELSMAVLSKMTYDLPGKLVEQPGTYAAVAEILQENARQINEILDMAREQSGIREQIAANYEKYATASTRLGDYATAEEAQNEAIAMYQELKSAWGEASARNNLGVIYNAQGKYVQAAEEYNTAAQLCRSAGGESELLAVILSNSGGNAMDSGDYTTAIPLLRQSLEVFDALKDTSTSQIARVEYNLGLCLMSTSDFSGAETALRASYEAYQTVYNGQQNRTNMKSCAQSLTQLALCLSNQAKLDAALELFPQAIAMLEELASGGDDATAEGLLGEAYNNYGLCLNMSGDFEHAAQWYIKFAELQSALYNETNSDLSRANMARAYYNVAENAFKLGDYDMVSEYYGVCLREYEPVSEALGTYHRAEYLARLGYYHIIVTHNYSKALTALSEAAELQPDSYFVNINYLYALMYNGKYDQCDALAAQLGAQSGGNALNVKLDFEALTAAGLGHEHMDAVLEIMEA